jgi:lipoprotein-anchoring transpeptidase ErfK/SrfK
MRNNYIRALAIGVTSAAALLSSCSMFQNTSIGKKQPYNVVAYKPHNPAAVRIKLSLANRAVYVMEGNRPLMVTAVTIGTPSKPTPTGNYHVEEKIKNKRSNSYGFWVNGNTIRPGTSDHSLGGHYVGYPMAYWVGFKPAYGFHQGAVWPIGHSHGCVRLHPNVVAKFYALARMGTPVTIAQHLPEDETIGKNLKRPTDYNDPDLPASVIVSSKVFQPPAGPLLQDQ